MVAAFLFGNLMRCGGRVEKSKVEERRHEVNLESVGEAGEEIERDEVGGNERNEKRRGGVAPEQHWRYGSSCRGGRNGGGSGAGAAIKKLGREELWRKGDEEAKNA